MWFPVRQVGAQEHLYQPLSFPEEVPTIQKQLEVSLNSTVRLAACRLWDVLSTVMSKKLRKPRGLQQNSLCPTGYQVWGLTCLKVAQGGEVQGPSPAAGSLILHSNWCPSRFSCFPQTFVSSASLFNISGPTSGALRSPQCQSSMINSKALMKFGTLTVFDERAIHFLSLPSFLGLINSTPNQLLNPREPTCTVQLHGHISLSPQLSCTGWLSKY